MAPCVGAHPKKSHANGSHEGAVMLCTAGVQERLASVHTTTLDDVVVWMHAAAKQALAGCESDIGMPGSQQLWQMTDAAGC